MRVLCKSEAFEELARYRREMLTPVQRCVMCALAVHSRAKPIFTSEVCSVILDRLGNRRGHLLVIPKKHLESFTELDIAEYQELQTAVFYAARAAERALRPRRVFVASTGASDDLPMSYPHFHMHVIPVYESDERARPANVLSWSQGVVAYDEDEALELSALIREHFAQGRGERPCVTGSP